jgi:hypothetical protein
MSILEERKIIVNSKNVRKKRKYKSIIGKGRRIFMKNYKIEFKTNMITSGQRSAQALKILKEGFANIEISKDDPIIKNILEGVKSYEK